MVAGLITLAAASGAAAVTLGDAPHAKLASFVCQTGLDPASRAISVTAVMRPVTGTEKMSMRFQLLKRAKRWSRPVALTGTDLNSWLTPKNPTLGSRPGDRWVVKHPVVDLAGPDFYRFKVAFRWIDASGHVIGKALREQRDVLPARETGRPRDRGRQGHAVDGRSRVRRIPGPGPEHRQDPSGQFNVEYSDGSTTHEKLILQLLPHHQRGVYFKEPACSAAAPATITADPEHMVDVSSRLDSSTTTTCPSSTTSLTGLTRPRKR